ncbi:hypothetical protein KAW64_16670 [bacterium]|nr:hypothetical protein [bacterium]
MADETFLVPRVSIETLGECLCLEVAKAFGRPVEEFTSSAHKEAYREMARELLTRARLVVPIKIVKGTVRFDSSDRTTQWIEPADGSPDVLLSSFGVEDELIELIQVEPERW